MMINTYIFLIGALLILLMPLDWVLSVFISSLFHEACHIFVVYMLNGRIQATKFHLFGCTLTTNRLGEWKQFISILAGPIGSLLLLSLYRCTPKIALCGLIQGVYNLIPIYPLDGGRLQKLFLQHFCPKQEELLTYIVTVIFCMILDIIALYLTFFTSAGVFPIVIALVCSIKTIPRKIPCKPQKIGVQ